MSPKKKPSPKKKAPAAPTAPAAAAPAKAGYKVGETVNFHHPLAPYSRDEWDHLEAKCKARGEKMPERGSYSMRPAIVAEGPSAKGQYLLRMIDTQEELVTVPGVKAGQFSA